jgi:pimeloyl-ACP methyl ester carboxylesterase
VKLAMKGQIKGSELEVFDRAGHALFVDEPDRFNQTLERFLANANKQQLGTGDDHIVVRAQ